jgi:hypothetical protein
MALEGYDDIVTFGHVLAGTILLGSDDAIATLLSYFEKPHKWEGEYQMWRAFGGTLDKECLSQFENWYDNRLESA